MYYFNLCLFMFLIVFSFSYMLVAIFNEKKEREKKNLQRLKRDEKVKKICGKLAKTLNRLDDFLDTWEQLKEEENK